jgi:glucuronoarabinoxylan endo-1,4-beta-xylanase
MDPDSTYQTMEGFGAFNTLSFWKDESYENKLDMITQDLGLSIMRFELPPTFHAVRDSAYNLRGWVFGGPTLEDNFRDVRELHKRGVNKFIATIWSPPAWMKTKNSKGEGPTTVLGGSLREDMYGAFAEYCAAYCRAFKEQTGVDLYGIGLQNEPEFVEPYNSCVYSPDQLREALRATGRKFREENISTKIYLPEALPAQQHVADFFNAVNNDEETRQYADIFAIHNYDRDGMNVGGAGAEQWEKYYRIANAVEPVKQLWMTETSGHPNTWKGAMLLAANIYNALRYGNINAWVWWALADQKSSEVYALVVDGKPSGRYFASKHFYRFIHPGAERIKASGNDEDILVLAFRNKEEFLYSMILINKSDLTKAVRLPKVRESAERKVYMSSDSLKCEIQPRETGKVISLPPQSIATVVWE